MVIEKLTLTDFGRHHKIEVDLDSPVVGLLGPNGCGKSTVLAAIEFAFTGRLEDEQKTYVRYFDTEGGATNATVEITFRKDGNRGSIMRRVGKSPKRLLKWDGREIKAAAEVESTLEQILGVDRSAIASSVFINQGEVQALVKGTNAEREALLTKLLVLSYLEDRSKVLEKKIHAMAAGIEDYSTMIDEQRVRINDALQALDEANKEFNAIPDMSAEIKRVEKLNALFERVAAIHRELQQNNATQLQKKEALANADRNLNSILGGLSYEDYQKQTKAELESIANEITKLSGLSSLKATVANKEAEVDNKHKVWSAQVEAKEKYEAELGGRSSAALQSVIAKKEAFKVATDAVVTAKAAMDAIQKRIDDNSTPDPDYEHRESYEANKEELTKERTELEAKLPLLEALEECDVEHDTPGSVTCPVCESTVASLKILEGLTVTGVREKIQELKKEESSLGSRLIDLIVDEEGRMKRQAQAQTELTTAQKVYLDASIKAQEVTDPQPDKTLEELKTEINSVSSIEVELRTAKAGDDRMRQEVTALEAEIKALKESPDWAAAEALSPNAIAEYQAKHKEITDKSSEVTNAMTTRQAAASQHEAAEETDKKLQEECQGIDAEVVKIVTDDDKIAGRHEDNATIKRQEYLFVLTDKQNLRQQASGKVTSCTAQLEKDRKRMTELELLQDKNVGRRALVEDLRRVREVFSRSGVKEHYIRHKFEQLAELTREFLMDLDANFTIDVDPDNATSFIFTRVDEEVVYQMPMNKLSGGQKVRLAIAFLMAVQRLVVPEVAFLVVDEPSDGLDEDGIESFKELIMEMRNKLANSDSQIIMCEHRPQLHVAFEKKLELK